MTGGVSQIGGLHRSGGYTDLGGDRGMCRTGGQTRRQRREQIEVRTRSGTGTDEGS